MKIYKVGLLVLVLVLIALSFMVYFKLAYNEHSITYDLKLPVSKSKLDKIINEDVPVYSLSYVSDSQKSYIMTTGHQNQFESYDLVKGQMVNSHQDKGIVLGDEVVGRTYKHLDVLGETYEFDNKTYEIIGILDNSDLVIIPYDASKLDGKWTSIRLSFHVKHLEDIPAVHAYLTTQLNLAGSLIRTDVVAYEYSLFFKNLAIFITCLWLLSYIVYRLVLTKDIFGKVKQVYEVDRVRLRWWQFVSKEKSPLIGLILQASAVLVLSMFLFYLAGGIHIPKRLLAANVMSVASWFAVFENAFDQLMISFDYGFLAIRRDFLMMAGLMIILTMRLKDSFKIWQVKDEN